MNFIYLRITPAITGEKARSGFESSTEGAMVDGNVIPHKFIHCYIQPDYEFF